MNVKPPVLGITMGDPAGIGPEVIVKALAREEIRQRCVPIVIGDPKVMEEARSLSPNAPPIRVVEDVPGHHPREEIMVLPSTSEDLSGIRWGEMDPRCGRAQVDFIRRAVELAVGKRIHAVVTGPIHKEGLRWARVPYPGHTEMLADWTGAREFAMMLAGEHLRVVPVTLHMGLAEAISALSVEGILRVVRLTHRSLKEWFGVHEPRLGVAGLNPHAGEGGLFGKEEVDIIGPSVERSREEGILAEGPFSPDAVFRMAVDGRFDAVVAMYHDQGLIPLKLLDRDNAVNITLGLPIIRTSVDHGTAYDLAGRGEASEGSMVAAICLAARLAMIKGFPS